MAEIILAVCGILTFAGTLLIQIINKAVLAGKFSEVVSGLSKRVDAVEESVDDHTRQLYKLVGEHKQIHQIQNYEGN